MMIDWLAGSNVRSQRLQAFEAHLKAENPALLNVLPTFYRFDRILHRMGLLKRQDSLVSRIPWWPLISVLGTFSSGKSTFINQYLGEKLQATGNQAVDDKFTILCFGAGDGNRVLPGTALDADPRFPFYNMSREIESATAGEGKRIETYLQLKTASAPVLKGKILVDSPGFDADDQRRATLSLTEHIINLSDLVLVFFDARHPEPGAMQDTLKHLVSDTVGRSDAGKFLYILNQIDTTAREDNPEDVVAAWQRAMAEAGLTAGGFYTIFNQDAAVPIADAGLRARYEAKRDLDMARIQKRIDDVEVERNYRIIAMLETAASELEGEIVPALKAALKRWSKWVGIGDGVVVAVIAALVATAWYLAGSDGADAAIATLSENLTLRIGAIAGLGAILVAAHFWLRGIIGRRIAAKLPTRTGLLDFNLMQAFLTNTKPYFSVLRSSPVGWSGLARKKLQRVRDEVSGHVQQLNSAYTDPSGSIHTAAVAAPAPEPVTEPETEPKAEPEPESPSVGMPAEADPDRAEN